MIQMTRSRDFKTFQECIILYDYLLVPGYGILQN